MSLLIHEPIPDDHYLKLSARLLAVLTTIMFISYNRRTACSYCRVDFLYNDWFSGYQWFYRIICNNSILCVGKAPLRKRSLPELHRAILCACCLLRDLDSHPSACYTQPQSEGSVSQQCRCAWNNTSSANRRALGLVELCLSRCAGLTGRFTRSLVGRFLFGRIIGRRTTNNQ